MDDLRTFNETLPVVDQKEVVKAFGSRNTLSTIIDIWANQKYSSPTTMFLVAVEFGYRLATKKYESLKLSKLMGE